MNQVRRWQRILILSLLLLSVLAPLVFVSNRLKSITSVGELLLIRFLQFNVYFSVADVRLMDSVVEHHV